MSLEMNKPGALNFQRMPKRNIMVRTHKPAPLNTTQRKQVKHLIKADDELKFNSQTLVPTVLAAGVWNIAFATQIPVQGVTDNQRIGDDINLINFVNRISLSTAAANEIRVVCFQWFPNTVPAVADVFRSTTLFGDYNPDTNHINMRVLSDRVYNFDTTQQVRMLVDKYHRFRKRQNFGLGGTNLIYIAACSLNAAGITGQQVYRYTDA